MFYIVMLCNMDTVETRADAGCILCILSHMRSYIGYKANTRPGLMMMQWCSDAVLSKFASCSCSDRRVLVGTDRCIFSINFVCRRHRVSYSAADRADGSWIGFYLDTDLILPLLKQVTIVVCVNINDFPSIMPLTVNIHPCQAQTDIAAMSVCINYLNRRVNSRISQDYKQDGLYWPVLCNQDWDSSITPRIQNPCMASAPETLDYSHLI